MSKIKMIDIQLDPETLTFTSGRIEKAFSTSHNGDDKDAYLKAVKEAKKQGLPEPETPKGINVPATIVVTLKGLTLEEVLENVPKPRIITLQNTLKNAKDAETFDKSVRDKVFTVSAVPEGRETLTPKEQWKKDVETGKISTQDAIELLEMLTGK